MIIWCLLSLLAVWVYCHVASKTSDKATKTYIEIIDHHYSESESKRNAKGGLDLSPLYMTPMRIGGTILLPLSAYPAITQPQLTYWWLGLVVFILFWTMLRFLNEDGVKQQIQSIDRRSFDPKLFLAKIHNQLYFYTVVALAPMVLSIAYILLQKGF